MYLGAVSVLHLHDDLVTVTGREHIQRNGNRVFRGEIMIQIGTAVSVAEQLPSELFIVDFRVILLDVLENGKAVSIRSGTADRVNFLTKYTCMQADNMIQRWRQLATFLIVRHNDMAVRPVDEKGNFKRGKYGLGERVQRPGYPEAYRRELISRTGDKLLKPAE